MSDMPCSITDGPQTPEEVGRLDGETMYRNSYECTCGALWQDEWSCECDDRCPECNLSIAPYESEEVVY